MLSASISNSEEIAEWLADVRGKKCKIISETERVVELRYGFIDPKMGITPLYSKNSEVFNQVERYYKDTKLDPEGMRVFRKGGKSNLRWKDKGGSDDNKSRKRRPRSKKGEK